MKFEEELRELISKSPHGSAEKNLLKVVLGEVQQKSAIGEFTDAMGYTIVKKMIKANEENLEVLPGDDARCDQFKQENRILEVLLPQYWSVEQIRQCLEANVVDIKAAKNDGQAMGMAMQHLKKLDAPVAGEEVKQAVAEMRS